MENSLLILLFTLLIISCVFTPNDKNKGGVVLTFDDRNIWDWQWADSVLSEYDWKATFCVYGVDDLSEPHFGVLRELKANGHEIAGHGLNHLNAVEYVREHGLESYISTEITPMIEIMDSNGVKPTSFAYPYGTFNDTINVEMYKYFKNLRSTCYGINDPIDCECFYENKPLVYGLGIDTYSSHFSISFFTNLLEYAHENDKIVIFYSHKPVETASKANQTDISTLTTICNYVNLHNMKFYTLSELSPER